MDYSPMTKIIRKMKPQLPIYVYVIVTGVLALSYVPLFFDEHTIDEFVREDHIIETLTAIYLFVAWVASAVAYIRSRRLDHYASHTWVKQLSYLALAVFLLVATGEEISWGQRILGLETPEWVKAVNAQDELTLHNLNIFQGPDAVFPYYRIFSGLSYLYALVIPFVAGIVPFVKRQLDRIMPVIPLSVGIFFAVNYVFQKFMMRLLRAYPQLWHHPTMRPPVAVYETREHGFALAWLVVILYILFVMLAPTQDAASE